MKIPLWTRLGGGIGTRFPSMANRLDPREVVVVPTAWGTNGSEIIELVDAPIDVAVSVKVRSSDKMWSVPLPVLIYRRRKRFTQVPKPVPLEPVEGCKLSEQIVRDPVPQAYPVVEKLSLQKWRGMIDGVTPGLAR